MRFCTACGTPVSGTRSYCTHCGAAIRRTADAHRTAGSAHATVPVLAAGPARPGPASPEPPSISLPSTWLADFDQRPAPAADRAAPAPPAAAPASGRTLLAVALVAVLIAAGSAAWMEGSSRPQPGHHPVAHSGVRPGSARPLARAAGSASPRPAGSTVIPIPSSRQGIVSVSHSLAGRADAQQVAGFLDSYFAAVNHREYQEYSSLFERWHHLTRAEFDRGYRTTHDSSALLTGLSSSKDSLTATVTFTSHQAPAASPNHASCTNWRIVLYLRRVGSQYLIGPPPPGYHATYHSCG
ncbi:MAG TPA: zinc ribbon domain-containing protein [Streptosporangiaceae bacterium]